MDKEDFIDDNGFWHLIRVRFDQTNGSVVTIIILLISIVTGNFASMYHGIVLFIGLILIMSIWTFYRTADDLFHQNIALKKEKNQLPSIIQVRKMDMEKDRALALCLLSHSELFSYNVLVTFYYYHRSYERAIGFGEVVNIQLEDKIIQVELTSILEGCEKILEKLIQNNAECLKCVRVKPTIPKKYLTQLREGGM